MVWLPDDAPAEVAGVRSAAWKQLCTALGRHDVTLSPTRAPPRATNNMAGGIESSTERSEPNMSNRMKADGSVGVTGTDMSVGNGEDGEQVSAQAPTSAKLYGVTDRASSGDVALAINAHVLPHPMGFRLTVCRQGVALVASDAPGLLYGVMCLCQLLDLYGEHFHAVADDSKMSQKEQQSHTMVSLPALCIEDYPDFAVRGAVIDARFPFTPRRERLLETVKELASWRVNALHLVLDENHPVPGQNGSLGPLNEIEANAVASTSTPTFWNLMRCANTTSLRQYQRGPQTVRYLSVPI